MTYEDKLKIFREEFDPWSGGIDPKFRFKLYSLLCLLTISARKKDPKITPYALLTKYGTQNQGSLSMVNMYTKISIQCECYLEDGAQRVLDYTKFDSYGFNKASDMITEINRIIDEWMPF
jgi:hypothetical protein